MEKRDFLKASGLLLADSLVSRFAFAKEHVQSRTNWSGNYSYRSQHLDEPKTVEEVQDFVRNRKNIKGLGTRHSFNGIADSAGDQISLKYLDAMQLDAKAGTVTVGAGVPYGKLAPYLDSRGFALHNLASLPHISVVGACATATHGSGNNNGNLATAVSGLEMVTAEGQLLTLSRDKDGDRFRAAVVGLGGLGVVTRVTLDVQPAFQMRQVVYENLSLSRLGDHFNDIFSAGYSVSVFTDWQNHRATQVWIKSRVDRSDVHAEVPPEFYGAKAATRDLHPLAGHSAENCTEQMGIPGPWYERLPHFRMNFMPSSGAELQSEYLLPREKGYEAILAVEQLRDRITPHLFISEFRTIAADDLWMSTAYQRPSMAIHFTWKPDWPAVRGILPLIEEKLAPYNARPHWAKLFVMDATTLHSRYEKWPAFQALLARQDPQGKFRNAYLNKNIYGA